MIIVLGGSGYVGSAILRVLQQRHIAHRSISRSEYDYTHASSLTRLLEETRPDFLINAAGFTGRPNVDACELRKAECLAGNAVLPGIINDVCQQFGLPWGHISSGCIFTGTRADGQGFTEQDQPNFSFRQNNCSFYSGCKALGEETLAAAQQCYVWRLRIPFDHHDGGRNYISKLMRYDRLLAATNSLTQLEECAAACIDSWTNRIPFGTYNLTNPGSVTTAEVVELIHQNRLTDRHFSFFESETQFLQQAAITPRSNCILDCSKALSAGLQLSPIHEALDTAMRNWIPAT